MWTGPNQILIAHLLRALDAAFDIIRGHSPRGFSMWVPSGPYINAYRYAMVRQGLRYEARLMPSDHQTRLSCHWIASLRVAAHALGHQIQPDVDLIESRGKPLMGELGFIFRTVQSKFSPSSLKELKFNVATQSLQLCPIYPQELPVITEDMKTSFKCTRELVDLCSDEEVPFL